MTEKELENKKYQLWLELDNLEKEYEKKMQDADKEFVESINQFHEGDIITDGKKIIRIERIVVDPSYAKLLVPPAWEYQGELLYKKLTGKGKQGKIRRTRLSMDNIKKIEENL